MNTIRYLRIIIIMSLILPLMGCTLILNTDHQEIEGVTNIHITLTENGLERLYESVSFGDEIFCWYKEEGDIYPGTIKVRGDITRLSPKKSYTITVEWPDGPVRYAFTGAYAEQSAIRNRVAMETYRVIGLPAPETKGTALFINGSYLGYYTQLTMYSENILTHFYETGNIELFKCNFAEYVNDIPLHSMSEKKIPGDDDFTSLDNLVFQALMLTDAAWNQWVFENFDIESTARYFLVLHYLAVRDTRFKNFMIALVDGKYLYLPWDNDSCMRRKFDGRFIPSSRYHFEGDNLLNKRLLSSGSPVKRRYDELVSSVILHDTTLTETVRDTITRFYAEIDRALYYDRNRNVTYEEFLAEYQVLMTFLDQRAGEFPE